MSHPPTGDKLTRWCSGGDIHEVLTRAAGYATEEAQCADHDSAVAALMSVYPEDC